MIRADSGCLAKRMWSLFGFSCTLLLIAVVALCKLKHDTAHDIANVRRQAQTLVDDKADILTAASHDLRQPLLAQGLFIEELKDLSIEQYPDIRHLVSMLETSNQSMHRLVSSVLEISRLDSCQVDPKFQHFPVSILLDELMVEFIPLAKQKKIHFRFRPIEEVVLTDADLLARILRNIISNAIRYTLKGEIILSCRIAHKYLCIEVQDTGIGIPSQKLHDIFKAFYQIDGIRRGTDAGLGLGLSIVDRLAKLLDHQIEVTSVLGQGTTFSVMVPLGLPYVHMAEPEV